MLSIDTVSCHCYVSMVLRLKSPTIGPSMETTFFGSVDGAGEVHMTSTFS